MTAREFLGQAHKIDLRINSKREQIQRLNELATKCTTTLTGMPHNPSPSQSPMADAICEIVDLENEITRDMQLLIQTKRDIVETIKQVKKIDYQTLLEKRYLNEETWETISLDMRVERRWLLRLHDKALVTVQKILNGNEIDH